MGVVEEIAKWDREHPEPDDEPPPPEDNGIEVLPHMLLWGPPGTGKTTLANVVTNSLEPVYGFKPNLVELTPMQLQNYKDVKNLIYQIKFGTVVFIDEIHSLAKIPMESLYNALEYGKFMQSFGAAKMLPRHTMIGATTKPGDLAEPFRERFLIDIELEPLDVSEIYNVLQDYSSGITYPDSFENYRGQPNAKILAQCHIDALNKKLFPISTDIQKEVARRAVGIPRIAKNILVHLIALSKSLARPLEITDANHMFEILGIDHNGLHRADRRVISALLARNNKPAGLAALASAASITKYDLENIVELRLVRLGYIERTPKGRILTPKTLDEYSREKPDKN